MNRFYGVLVRGGGAERSERRPFLCFSSFSLFLSIIVSCLHSLRTPQPRRAAIYHTQQFYVLLRNVRRVVRCVVPQE